MDFYTLAALPLSAERGWPELLRARPGWRRLFFQLVLPVALLPPAVLYLAGTVRPGAFGAGGHPWSELSMVVLIAEFASVAAAGRLFRQIAGAHGLVIARREARLLSALAPLPIWASAAGFALPGVVAPVLRNLPKVSDTSARPPSCFIVLNHGSPLVTVRVGVTNLIAAVALLPVL